MEYFSDMPWWGWWFCIGPISLLLLLGLAVQLIGSRPARKPTEKDIEPAIEKLEWRAGLIARHGVAELSPKLDDILADVTIAIHVLMKLTVRGNKKAIVAMACFLDFRGVRTSFLRNPDYLNHTCNKVTEALKQLGDGNSVLALHEAIVRNPDNFACYSQLRALEVLVDAHGRECDNILLERLRSSYRTKGDVGRAIANTAEQLIASRPKRT